MAFRALGPVMVLRHADAKPDPADWNGFIEAFVDAPLHKLLVWSPGVASPSSAQRASAVTALRGKGSGFRGAVLTSSTIARGAATAISWFGPKLRGFALDEMLRAIAWLELAEADVPELEAAIASLGSEVDDDDPRVRPPAPP